MRVDIVPLGNSRGIRLPKTLLDQCGFDLSAEVVVEDDHLVITPVSSIRAGWEEKFQAMSATHDEPLHETPPSAFDAKEWQW